MRLTFLLSLSLVTLAVAAPAAAADDRYGDLDYRGGGPIGPAFEPPQLDMGSTTLENAVDASPAVQRAMKRVSRKIKRCFAVEPIVGESLQGEIVSRFAIAQSGRAVDVRIVQSNLGDRMGRCVKRAILNTRFAPHGQAEPIVVVAPWALVARAG